MQSRKKKKGEGVVWYEKLFFFFSFFKNANLMNISLYFFRNVGVHLQGTPFFGSS